MKAGVYPTEETVAMPWPASGAESGQFRAELSQPLRCLYITGITRTRSGKPTREFIERWAPYVRGEGDGG